MAIQSKTTIKSYFETNDVPTQAQFGDLVDSYEDTGTAATAVCTHNTSTAAHADIREMTGYNVKDYGAIGDKMTDDLAACS